MAFKRLKIFRDFRLQMTIRVAGIIATVLAGALGWSCVNHRGLLVFGGILLSIQAYALIHYAEKSYRELTRFFEAIEYSEFSQSFSGKGFGASLEALYAVFSKIIRKFHKLNTEKEAHFRYLQTVVQHIQIGLLAYYPSGEIELSNKAARRLLRIHRLKNIASLSSWGKPLVDTLVEIKAGEKALVKIQDGARSLHLAIHATSLMMQGRHIKLVSLQDIQSELETTEMEAWQNLIRVLTHEMMNSMTPITSLAATVNQILRQNRGNFSPDKTGEMVLEEVQKVMETIQRRSNGLLEFVERYRQLLSLPTPKLQKIAVKDLLDRITPLFRADLQKRSIDLTVQVSPADLKIMADPQLIEQVLINLLKNAIEAIHKPADGCIIVNAYLNEWRGEVFEIIDNGPGIPDDMKERIFIPFFTTKKNGSGIGLSLCRQIMQRHGGGISVYRDGAERTVFTLRF